MDGVDERQSQPPLPRCTRGCWPGCCFCAELDSDEEGETDEY
jgi:hypothetical protein